MSLAITLACKKAFLAPRNSNLVVIVAPKLLERYEKVATALKEDGVKVIFLTGENLPEPPQWAAEMHIFKSVEESLYLACRYNPIAYHVFCNWNFTVALALTHFHPGPVVIDNYDVLYGMVVDEREDFVPLRRDEFLAMTLADGHACRSLETQVLNRMGGPLRPLRGVRGFFPDSCWNRQQIKLPVKRKPGEFHLVYEGNVEPDFFNQNERLNYHPWLANRCREQRIHYHLYPSNFPADGSYDKIYASFIELDRKSEYFHLYHTLPIAELLPRLSQYDAGIFMTGFDHSLPSNSYNLNKHKHSSANKIFDYYEAGLPTIIFGAWFLSALMDRYGGNVTLKLENLSNLREVLENADWKKLRAGALRAREVFDYRKMGPRLKIFYKKAAEVADQIKESTSYTQPIRARDRTTT